MAPRPKRPPPTPPLPIDLARLPKMPLAELRALWDEHIGRGTPPQRRLLIRELAWRIQERHLAGFDAQTRRLLQEAVRAATNAKSPTTRTRPKGKPRTPPKLPPAARIIREWRGQRHEVIVVESGRAYQYSGRTYRSLTDVAHAITGTHQSGPRFFGITSRSRKPASATSLKVGGR